jgi:hypothetical protein
VVVVVVVVVVLEEELVAEVEIETEEIGTDGPVEDIGLVEAYVVEVDRIEPDALQDVLVGNSLEQATVRRYLRYPNLGTISPISIEERRGIPVPLRHDICDSRRQNSPPLLLLLLWDCCRFQLLHVDLDILLTQIFALF